MVMAISFLVYMARIMSYFGDVRLRQDNGKEGQCEIGAEIARR